MESTPASPRCNFYLCFLLLLFCFSTSFAANVSNAGDIAALLALKNSVDTQDSLPWRRETASWLCREWKGVKQCSPVSRVTKLVLEFLNLTGTLSRDLLAPFDQLRVLSLKSNSLSGAIPDLSPLVNLKSLYLSDNQFFGRIPANLNALHRLKVVVLSGNLLSGPIPESLISLPRLYEILLEGNHLTGQIPAFDQPSLRYLNVSRNNLSGEIPATQALSQFNASSFLNNANLCGAQIGTPCVQKLIFPPSSISPGSPFDHVNAFPPFMPPTGSNHSRRRIIAIVASSVAGALFLSICSALALLLAWNRKRRRPVVETRTVGRGSGGGRYKPEKEEGAVVVGGGGGGREEEKGVFSWEAEGLEKLVFCGGVREMYSLEELLRASAETLGRGTVGSTYKAVMESGFIVTVKRLKDASRPPTEAFRQRMEELGRLRHPNLVPLRAYFQAKEERLLVYDYFPNGSLFSLIHGSRPSGSGKPLHWTSCLKIAEDVATGLAFLHQNSPPTVHANLKPANVLLGPDFESCLADYALIPALFHDDAFPSSSSSAAAAAAASLFYRAPEARSTHAFTPLSDVYSFGVLLLELLTGKAPFQDILDKNGAEIGRWVRSVRAAERNDSREEPGGGSSSGNEAAASEEKLTTLLNIASSCVVVEAERRPAIREVLLMIREARAEAMVASSNSSDHSPGR
ncbi:inactive leucine-rich repeat receptor-like serine/threonine-protein kinase At1g60630 [Zingiber officinale]|uniref:inactive leucine-rich repeat receptor-like serine/threonine-protein kinase At1g60630 n=1 Tax=Zingiber officinale TaxID=94328 RepID=UPI001C4D320A|nr:inactive leucine-rich repeat receptor-like serine/threonine-protein kinase At1g60630 [Zingiber officinale]